MANWEYGGIYHTVNMEGIINLPNESKLKVCDLTEELPEFMKEADTLFIDPPCSTGNLRSFHTKADQELPYTFGHFEQMLFTRIDQIRPKHLFIEVFKSNKEAFEKRCAQMYRFVNIHESFYYNKPKNRCWILHASNDVVRYSELDNIDEEKAIKWICANHECQCIGDLCMGRGLVGRYAFQAGKKFVGTELNKKRLAILVDYINKQA